MKKSTNVKLVTEIMESSPLAQAMVIEALTKYVDEVAAMDPKQIESNGLVNMHAWVDIAANIKKKLDEHYG